MQTCSFSIAIAGLTSIGTNSSLLNSLQSFDIYYGATRPKQKTGSLG